MKVERVEHDTYTDTHGRREYAARFLAFDGEIVLGAGDTIEEALADASHTAIQACVAEPESVVIWDQGEVALHCTSGMVQYASSVESMLAEYNRNARVYEVRTDDEGEQILWHKGHNTVVGAFKPSNRA